MTERPSLRDSGPAPADPVLAKAQAGALVLARQRLRRTTTEVCELAGRGHIPAARMAMDDAMSELDEIQRLRDELEGQQ